MDDFSKLEGGDIIKFNNGKDEQVTGMIKQIFISGYFVYPLIGGTWRDSNYVTYEMIEELVKFEYHGADLTDSLIKYSDDDVHKLGLVIGQNKNYCLVMHDDENPEMVHRKDIIKILNITY